MRSTRVPRPYVIIALILILLWVAGFGLLLRGRGANPFPAAQTVDHRLSAQPGVNLADDELAPGALAARLDQLATQGVRYVRFTVPWDEVERERGAWQWGRWDEVVAVFAARPALIPVVVLDRSPEWARRTEDAGNPLAPPQERRDFGAFARAVADRYGNAFTYYQVWDEPNIAPHWGERPADPTDYLGLLREGAINIRAADNDARILAAALAPTTEESPANLNDITYLDRLYALGGHAWFDYPAAQPYGFSAPPDAPADPGTLNFARATLLRDVMLRHGDGASALWSTAFGWHAGEDGPFGEVPAEQQTAHTKRAFELAARQWPWLGPLLWTDRFAPVDATATALADAALLPKTLPPGRHAPDHPALWYTGWRATAEAADPSQDGDALEFSFDGEGVALEVSGGPYWAYLTVSVDGAPANRLPRDESGLSYLVLHDPNAVTRQIPLATGLRAGLHTVRISATGGWGQWPLRAVVVSAETPQPPPAGGILLILAALGTAALAARIFNLRRQDARQVGHLRYEPSAQAESLRYTALVALGASLAVAYHLTGSGTLNFAILALFGLLFLYDPGLAPPLIAASLPLWQRTQPVLRWEFGLFEVLAWIAVLAWIGHGAFAWVWPAVNPARIDESLRSTSTCRDLFIRGRFAVGRAGLLDLTLLALFAAGLLATLFGAEQGVAWREFRIVFLFGLVFYGLITRGGLNRATVRPLVAGLLAGVTVAALAGLWQLITGRGMVQVEGVSRIAGFYGSPNNLALILDRAVPLALALALFGSFGSRTWLFRAVLGAVALICLLAAVATFSKGALLLGLPAGIAVVLLGGAWRSGKRWPLGSLLGLLVVAAAGLLVLFQTPRFAGLFNFESGTSFFRLKLWQGALNMALDHPIFGVGPDNFLYAYRTRYVLPSAWQELNLSHPHNVFLDLWTRLGLIGVIAGFSSLVAASVAGWRSLVVERRASLPNSRAWPLALGLLGGLTATVAHGLIDNSLFLPDLMGWFVSVMGIFWLMMVRQEG
jgi:hypothetical protein